MTSFIASDPSTHVRTVGTGEPTFVLVHGFACGLDDWSGQIKAIAPRFRCVALDLPGHAGSAAPDRPTLAAMGEAVNATKRASGGRTFILVGHSLGCKIIREAYALESKDVVGLVMIDGAFYDGDRETLFERARGLIAAEGFAAYARRHFEAMFLPGTDAEAKARIVARAAALDPAFGTALYLEAVGWDAVRGKESLRRIGVPLLVLQATHLDATFTRQPLEAGMRTPFMTLASTLVPDCEATVIPGSGHFPMLDQPAATSAALLAFAERLGAG